MEKHQEQLLEYSYREGVELAALTNGITWWFYLPTEKGNWQERKFYTVDIQEQESSDIARKLKDIMGKDNVENGQALRYAEEIYKGKRRKNQIEKTIPEAWNKIVSEPDTSLVNLLVDTTGKLCGLTPDSVTVTEFLKSHQEHFQLSEPEGLGIERARYATRRLSGRDLSGERKPYRGRKGYNQMEHYIIPVITMMRRGIPPKEAFRRQTGILNVDPTTVRAQCTRALNINMREFLTRVSDGTIVNLLKRRYPDESDVIDKELGGK